MDVEEFKDGPVGLYRIQTVARLTGVPAAVLRAWEKRYGVPTPRRTEAAYRLYTEEDVTQIRRLCALRESGLAASEAARLVLSGEPPPNTPFGGGATSVERLLAAARAMDGPAIDQCLSSLATHGNARKAFEQVISPVLRTLGELWEARLISEAEEHLLSEHIAFVLRSWLLLARPSSGAKLALIACYADELHTIPSYGVALRWASLGWDPVVLGARTSPLALHQAVERLSPGMVGLSMIAPLAEAGIKLLPSYAAACEGVPWMVGGAASVKVADEVRALGGMVGEQAAEFEVRAARSLSPRASAPSRR
jgi:MerR family transcriptional regulator, light-induced transcriptional regulator